MSKVICLCKTWSCYIGGARATGVYGVICTWAVTHMGVGKRLFSAGVSNGVGIFNTKFNRFLISKWINQTISVKI